MKDKTGRPWTNIRPPYEINPDIEQLVQLEFDKLYDTTDEIQSFIVPLPFMCQPMWPPKIEKVKNPIDFLYCICPKCAYPIDDEYGQLCIQFTVVQTSKKRHIFWRPRICCCNVKLSHSISILEVEITLKSSFIAAVKGFDDNLNISQKICYVCEDKLPCDDKICKKLLDYISMKQTCEERLFNLLVYFKETKLDILSPLIGSKYCSNTNCDNLANPSVICLNCRVVFYCSKKCKKLHKNCENYLRIWRW